MGWFDELCAPWRYSCVAKVHACKWQVVWPTYDTLQRRYIFNISYISNDIECIRLTVVATEQKFHFNRHPITK